MKLSIQIFNDYLQAYHPQATIKSNKFEIDAVRLFAADVTPERNTIYVGRLKDLFVTDSNNIICTHNNDMLLLDTDDLESVLNIILNTLARYAAWENEIMRLITSGGMLQDLVDVSGELLPFPILLLDQSQRLLAYNKDFEDQDIDPMWTEILSKGTNSMDFLIEFNRFDPERFQRTDLYTYDKPVFPNNAWHYNFHANKRFVGTATIIIPDEQFSEGQRNTFLLFCRSIDQWFSAHIQDQQYIMLDTQLQKSISEQDADSNELQRLLLLLDWKKDDTLIFYKLDASYQPYNINRYLCNSLNMALDGVFAITHGLSVCLLCDLTLCDRNKIETQLQSLLQTSNYYATVGHTFQMKESFYDNYQFISIVSEHVPKDPGLINNGNAYTLPYLLEKMQQTVLPDILHPAVSYLAAYDQKHNTEFSKTLYSYIKNGRRFADTVDDLHLHRNTLKYRLKRLQELLDIDLDNPSTRLHLWLSFEIYISSSSETPPTY